MKIAIYGGSFNPPHIAHAWVVSWLLWTKKVDQVWLIPVYHHAFEGKQDKKLVPFEERLHWCEIFAAQISPDILVSAIEKDLPTPSYTIDTLEELSKRYPEHQFQLCIGSDIIPQLPKWKDWNKIKKVFTPIIVGRGGYGDGEEDISFPKISSTTIRRSLGEGEIPTQFLLSSVAAAIEKDNPFILS